MRARWFSVAALALSSVAWGKPTSKMTEAELVTQLQTHKSEKQRELAADALGERRAVDAIPALRGACAPTGHPFV
ncbi:MAG TPA: hypothetical protein PKA64_09775, partial [Myxococcota bacterium]|nr:hypothetical protein [Myxococcota bacterium]